MSTTYDPTPYRSARVDTSSRLSLWDGVRYTLIAVTTLLLIHTTAAWIAPGQSYASSSRSTWSPSAQTLGNLESNGADHLRWSEGSGAGTFRRDPYPLRTILALWDLAEKEVAARGLDTCDDQLGRRFIDAYHETDFAYCTPGGQALGPGETATARKTAGAPITNLSSTLVTCSAIQRNSFTSWWPYPAAPCISTNLRLVKGERKAFQTVGCDITTAGAQLDKEMDNEDFIGLHTTRLEDGDPAAVCREVVNHTAILIGRQDQWNP